MTTRALFKFDDGCSGHSVRTDGIGNPAEARRLIAGAAGVFDEPMSSFDPAEFASIFVSTKRRNSGLNE